MTTKGNNGTAVSPTSGASNGINTINDALCSGQPIIIGVDYRGGSPNYDGMTDHFIVITGSVTVINSDGSRTTTYNFYDPAAKDKSTGASSDNTLTVNNGMLTGSFGGNNYTVTTVRPNL